MQQKRLVFIVGGVLAALLVAAIVLLSVLIGTLNKQSSDDAYRECMTSLGVGNGGPVTDTDDMVDAAEFCSRQ